MPVKCVGQQDTQPACLLFALQGWLLGWSFDDSYQYNRILMSTINPATNLDPCKLTTVNRHYVLKLFYLDGLIIEKNLKQIIRSCYQQAYFHLTRNNSWNLKKLS